MRLLLPLLFFAILVLIIESKRSGGFGRSKSRSSWGSLFKKKPKQPQGPAYPKQTYSASGGFANRPTANQGGIGGGGFVNPAGKGVGTGGSRGSAIGGGGFVNPNFRNPSANAYSNFGGNRQIYNNKYVSNNYYGNTYTGFGSSNFGRRNLGSLGGGISSGKAFGLGVGAGFIGGAVAGIGAMEVYHRYKMFKYMMMYRGFESMGYGYNPYVGSMYGMGGGVSCFGGCPSFAFCDYGICRCYSGQTAMFGSCWFSQNAWNSEYAARRDMYDRRLGKGFDYSPACSDNSDCWKIDMNMICNNSLGGNRKCRCRPDMKWNEDGGECQIFIDVDCTNVVKSKEHETNITTTLKPDTFRNLTVVPDTDVPGTVPYVNGSVDANITLANSELLKLDVNSSSAQDIKESFCRDVDRYAVSTPQQQAPNPGVRYPDSKDVGGYTGLVSVVIIIIFAGCIVFIVMKMCKSRNGSESSSSGRSTDYDNKNNVYVDVPMAQTSVPLSSTGNPGGVMYPAPVLPEGAVGAPAAPGYGVLPPYEAGGLPYPVHSATNPPMAGAVPVYPSTTAY